MKSSAYPDGSLWTLLPELYGYLSAQRRRQLYLLLALMILGAVAELATLGSVLPLLSLLAGVSQPARFPSLQGLFAAMGANTPANQLWVAAGLFGAMAVFAGAIRIALTWSTQMFTALLGHELTVQVQRRILGQPYAFHLTRNSSQAVAAIDTVEALVVYVVLQLAYAVAAAFIALVIVAALIYVDPFTASITAVSFSVLYLLISGASRPRLKRNSEAIHTSYEKRVRIVQESVGGIRDVIIDGAQRLYLDAFANVSRKYGMAAANTAFLAAAPRFVVEAVGMAIIAAVSVLIAGREGGFAFALPLLGAIALGAQRLLPLLQQVYHGWASVSGHRSVVVEALALLRLPLPADHSTHATRDALPLRSGVSIEGLGFAYPGSRRPVFHDVSVQLPRGSMVGIIGRTGSGKSTLADLIMGLIEPTEGRIAIDGATLSGSAKLGWQRNIAHVPQTIFLSDASIAQNIAFGVLEERIDWDRMRKAAVTAQLDEFVNSLPEGYQTTVGERGVRLSGGQRQRLGIARAIYKQAAVLVLDEATSALDELTEAAVIDSLAALGEEGRTIIIIAHRPSTLRRCDFLVRIEAGRATVTKAVPDSAELTSAER